MTHTLGRFFLPGPTEIHPDIAEAMQRPMMSHRGAAFRALFARVQAGLREFFGTAHPVVVVPASASAMMEMSLRCAPPGRVLALVNGGFSARFAEYARACGRDVDTIDEPWGGTFDLAQLERALAGREYAVLTVVHCETSTGVLSDVRRVTDLAHRHGAVVLVDGVTSVGSTPCDADAWGLDFVFAGSQKTLALPPGLALAAVQPSFVERARSLDGRGRYLDVVEYVLAAARNETPTTPALSLWHGLDAQVERIAAIGGFAARRAQHAALAAEMHAWADARGAEGHGVRVLAPHGARAPAVTVLALDGRIGPRAMLQGLHARGFTIGGGYGPLRDSCVRIGHFGDHTMSGLRELLAAMDAVLRLNAPTAQPPGFPRHPTPSR